MRKLSKEQIKERNDISARLTTALDELERTITDFNDQVKDLYEITVARDLAALNEVIEEAQEFKDNIITAMNDYTSERSEKWGESEAGQSYAGWISEWEYLELEPVELGPPDNIDRPDIDAEVLNNLPEEPG